MMKHCLVGMWENSTNWSLICKVGGQLPTGILSLDTNPVYYIDAWDCKNVFLLFHLEGDVKCSQPYPGSLCSLVKPHQFLIISSYIQELSILNIFGFPGRCWYLLQSGRFNTSGGQELRGALGMNTRLICIFNWPDCWLGFDSIPTWIFLVQCKSCPSSYLTWVAGLGCGR